MFHLEFHQKSGKSEKVFFSGEETRSIHFFYSKVDIVFQGEEAQDEVTLLVGESYMEIRLVKRIEESLALSRQGVIDLWHNKAELDSATLEQLSKTSKRFLHQVSLDQSKFINNLDWGDFPLTLRIDGKLKPIGKIRRNKVIGAKKGGHVKEIVQVVFGSPHTLIYEKGFISNEKDLFGRGSRYRTAFECLVYQKRMLEELEKWNREELRLPERVVEEKRRVTYSPSLRMDSKSLRLIASNPSNFFPSPAGQLEIEGRRFSLTKVDTLVKSISYDTNDGRLLINTAIDIRNTAAKHADIEFDGQAKALNDLNQQLGNEIKNFCTRHNLPERNRKAISNPALMRKLIRCKEIVNLVDGWIHLRELDPREGESSLNWAFPLNSLEKLWEYFCLERIVQSFKELGLDYNDIEEGKKDSVRVISINGERGWARIFYEPLIRPGKNQSIINLKSHKNIENKILDKTQKETSKTVNTFEPDYLVDSNIDGHHRVGILDAKFSPDPTHWIGRTKEIISKYSPWLRKLNGQNLDYYVSMVPSSDHHDFYSMVSDDLPASGLTQFGCLAVRMESSDPFAKNHLKSFFTQRTTEISENN